MASKGGKKVILVKKKKSGSKKGTTGGQSFRNYTKKSKNLDYRYRIQDIDDISSQDSLQNLYSTPDRRWKIYYNYLYNDLGWDSAFINSIKPYYTAFCNYNMNTLCWFIPLSTTSFVSKNMTVDIRSPYPFAYCIFQNTSQFKRAFEYYSSGEFYSQLPKSITDKFKGTGDNELARKATQQLFQNLSVNIGGQNDSIIGFCMAGHDNSQSNYFNDNKTVASMSWPQICQSQSSYREIRNASNSGLYSTTVNCYYTRASQYLTNSTNPGPVLYGYKTQNVSATIDSDWRTADVRTCYNLKESIQDGTSLYDKIFRGGDMMICIMPMYYLQMIDPTAYTQNFPNPQVSPVIKNFPQVRVARHYYLLNQDVGIRNVSIQEYQLKIISKVLKYLLNVPTANTQGGGGPFNNGLMRNIHKRNQGIQVSPIVRSDLDEVASRENCVVVDEKCYDQVNQELQMTAYMDLNTVPANQGTQALENVEGEDTMNCNAIVSAGNNTDPNTCYDVSITNTGPALLQSSSSSVILTTRSFAMNTDAFSTYSTLETQQGFLAPTFSQTYQTQQPPDIKEIYSAFDRAFSVFSVQVPIQIVEPGWTESGGVWGFDFSNCQYVGIADASRVQNPYIKIYMLQNIVTSSDPNQYTVYSCTPAIEIVPYTPQGESEQNSITLTPLLYDSLITMWDIIVKQIVYYFPATYDIKDLYAEYNFNQLNIVQDWSHDLYPVSTFDAGEYYGMVGFLRAWIQCYNQYSLQARGEGWKRFKGALSKVAKFVFGKALPIATKVASAVVPAPYGTVVSAVGNAVSNITTQLNLAAAKKNNNTTSVAAVQDDTVVDQFVVTPQYRLSDDATPQDIAAQGTDWVDGDPITVDVDQYGNGVVGGAIHDLRQHPSYYRIMQNLSQRALQGVDPAAYCQQRIKVNFRKSNVTPEVARGYKAVMTLGSDTVYASDEDMQLIDTQEETQTVQNQPLE